MEKKRNIESASVFERSGIRAIRVRATDVLLYVVIAVYFAIFDDVASLSSMG